MPINLLVIDLPYMYSTYPPLSTCMRHLSLLLCKSLRDVCRGSKNVSIRLCSCVLEVSRLEVPIGHPNRAQSFKNVFVVAGQEFTLILPRSLNTL